MHVTVAILIHVNKPAVFSLIRWQLTSPTPMAYPWREARFTEMVNITEVNLVNDFKEKAFVWCMTFGSMKGSFYLGIMTSDQPNHRKEISCQKTSAYKLSLVG